MLAGDKGDWIKLGSVCMLIASKFAEIDENLILIREITEFMKAGSKGGNSGEFNLPLKHSSLKELIKNHLNKSGKYEIEAFTFEEIVNLEN